MSDQQASLGDVEPMVLLSELLTNLPASTASNPSSFWSLEQEAGAIKASILRHIKAGWTWNAPFLEKGQVRKRPSLLMPWKTPADRGFNPRTDAFVLSMGAEFIGEGKWRGYYRLGEHLMRHDGALVDPEDCPECGGYPWLVKVPHNPFERRTVPAQRFTYCRRCVKPEEVEEAAYRLQQFADKALEVRAKQEARRRMNRGGTR